MAVREGLRIALNEIRQTSIDNGTLYAKSVDEIYPTTDITAFAQPLLANPDLVNEFLNVLAKRIVYTSIEMKLFNNPLQILEGEQIPLGAIGQEIFINSAKARKFDVNDFAGLLAKYESDTKVQYLDVNSDLQYCVTITREKIRNAFTTWENLNDFVDGLQQSLYNGCYIDRFNMSKALVSQAYEGNNVQIQTISAIESEATAKAFIQKAREIFLNMKLPSTQYNAWAKVGGYGRAIKTWSNPEDIVFLIRNDMASYIDVNVLASAFNIDKTSLLGRIIYVDSFDVYDNDDETKLIDGSNIVAFMGDKRWFRIKTQDFATDEFYNANCRCWNVYLNDTRMYKYSLFANAVVFATAMPDVKATKVEFIDDTAFEIEEGEKVTRKVKLTPINSTSSTTFTSADSTKVKVTKISDTEVEIEGVDAYATAITITATNNSQTDTISVTCVSGT